MASRNIVVFGGDLLMSSPGLRAEFDADEAGKYAYQRACLPINRLTDGMIHDWS